MHLHDGGVSLQKYEAGIAASKIKLVGFGGMWFGGPHMALQGNPATVRAENEANIALAAKHPQMMPIATVHPYDGQAALDELARVAARGVKVIKLHGRARPGRTDGQRQHPSGR